MKYLFRDNCVGISIFRQAGVAPSITLVSIENITDNSATSNVSIADGDDVSKTGVQVDTDPTFSNPTSYEQNGAVNSIAIDNLNAETTYYVRAYVIWNGQTIYSANSLNFTTASGSILPAELQGCEYLETDGNSFIYTGCYGQNYANFELKMSIAEGSVGNSIVFGSRTSNASNNFIIYPAITANEFRIWYGGNTLFYKSLNLTNNKDFIVKANNNNFNVYDFNENLIFSNTFNLYNFTPHYQLLLFGALLPSVSYSQASTKIYSNKIGNLRDYVAAYIKAGQTFTDNKGNTCPAGTCGMYDVVNQVFYTNDGTGTFSKGADINI